MAQFNIVSEDDSRGYHTGSCATIVSVDLNTRAVDVTVLVILPKTDRGSSFEEVGVAGDAPFGDEWAFIGEAGLCPIQLYTMASGMCVDCVDDGSATGYERRQRLYRFLAHQIATEGTAVHSGGGGGGGCGSTC